MVWESGWLPNVDNLVNKEKRHSILQISMDANNTYLRISWSYIFPSVGEFQSFNHEAFQENISILSSLVEIY